MTTPAIIIGIVYVLALTSSVVPLAVGLEPKGENSFGRRLLVALVFAASQSLMAFVGYLIGSLIDYMFGDLLPYLVFAMMLVVAVKMIVDSMKVLKAKRLYSFTSNWGFLLLGILAGMNTLLMGICSEGFMPFGPWFFLVVAVAAFLWAMVAIRVPYTPEVLRGTSFVEFSGAVFILIIAILFLFTDLI